MHAERSSAGLTILPEGWPGGWRLPPSATACFLTQSIHGDLVEPGLTQSPSVALLVRIRWLPFCVHSGMLSKKLSDLLPRSHMRPGNTRVPGGLCAWAGMAEMEVITSVWAPES